MNIIEAETVWGRWVKMLLLCLLGIFFAPLLLWLGYKRMQNMPEDDPNCKFLKKILLGGLLFIVIGFGYLVWKLMPEDGEHAAHVPWLPTAASDISYYRKAFDRELYEYRISENDFRSLYHLEVAQEKQPETAGAGDHFPPEHQQGYIRWSPALHWKRKRLEQSYLIPETGAPSRGCESLTAHTLRNSHRILLPSRWVKNSS